MTQELLLFWIVPYTLAKKYLTSTSQISQETCICEKPDYTYALENIPENCPGCEHPTAFLLLTFLPYIELVEAKDKERIRLLKATQKDQLRGEIRLPQAFYGCRTCLQQQMSLLYSEHIFTPLLLGISDLTVLIKQDFLQKNPFEDGLFPYYTNAHTVEEVLEQHMGIKPVLGTKV